MTDLCGIRREIGQLGQPLAAILGRASGVRHRPGSVHVLVENIINERFMARGAVVAVDRLEVRDSQSITIVGGSVLEVKAVDGPRMVVPEDIGPIGVVVVKVPEHHGYPPFALIAVGRAASLRFDQSSG